MLVCAAALRAAVSDARSITWWRVGYWVMGSQWLNRKSKDGFTTARLMMVRRRQDLICKLSPSRPSRQNQPRAPLRALLALGEARGLPEDDRSASREASSCTPSVEARAAANPIGERDAVARRGGAVRRAAQAADPHFLPDRRTEAEIAAALITLPTVDQAHLG